ncbi:MAG: UbiA family prenyltransferase [Candidatus Aenigmarchaeota archaeon]|nr:UbiA family prenyltransferase [Candidatus Aenigmarchaeota archaeon]
MPGYFSILRPSVCFLSAFAIFVGSIVAGSIAFPLFVLYAIIASFLITGAGNAVNDIFDVEIDKINAPHRPIPAGKISTNSAWFYFMILEIIGLVFAAMINMNFLLIAVINSVLLFIYSWKLKPVALIGNITVAFLAASNFIAAGLILFNYSALPYAILIISAISFFGTLSRELIKDTADVKGDRAKNSKTLPVLIGEKKTLALAYIILMLTVISLALPVYLNLFTYVYLVGAVPAVLLSLYAMKKKPEKSHKYVKMAMYFVILGFVLGAVL